MAEEELPSGSSISTSGYYFLATKADSDLVDGPCRGLWVGTAGTANLMDALGNTRVGVPLLVGFNPFQCLQIRTGGTADNIWALY